MTLFPLYPAANRQRYLFSGRGKAHPYNLSAQKQHWHSALGQLIEKVLSEREADLDPNYLRYTALSVGGSGVGCRGGECRGSR